MIVRCTRCSTPYDVPDGTAVFTCTVCGTDQAPAPAGSRGAAGDAVRDQLGGEVLFTVQIDALVYGLAEFPPPVLVVVLLDRAARRWQAYAARPDWISFDDAGIVGLDRVVREGTCIAGSVASEMFPFMNPTRYMAVDN